MKNNNIPDSYFATNLKFLRQKHNMEQLELANRLGRKSSSSISEWEKGRYTPKAGILNDIAKIFGIPLTKLMNEDLSLSNETTLDKINQISSQLEEKRQETVMKFSKMQLDEQNARARRNIKIKVIKNPQDVEEPVKLYPVKAKEHVALAAGLGFSYNDTGEYATYYTMRNDLACFDEAVPVDGESMEPLVHDGDIALIKTNYSKTDGCIYAFDYDGKSYIKYLYFYDDKIVVKSENKDKFDDWEIRFDDLAYDSFLYFKIVGEVVDWFTPEVV